MKMKNPLGVPIKPGKAEKTITPKVGQQNLSKQKEK